MAEEARERAEERIVATVLEGMFTGEGEDEIENHVHLLVAMWRRSNVRTALHLEILLNYAVRCGMHPHLVLEIVRAGEEGAEPCVARDALESPGCVPNTAALVAALGLVRAPSPDRVPSLSRLRRETSL